MGTGLSIKCNSHTCHSQPTHHLTPRSLIVAARNARLRGLGGGRAETFRKGSCQLGGPSGGFLAPAEEATLAETGGGARLSATVARWGPSFGGARGVVQCRLPGCCACGRIKGREGYLVIGDQWIRPRDFENGRCVHMLGAVGRWRVFHNPPWNRELGEIARRYQERAKNTKIPSTVGCNPAVGVVCTLEGARNKDGSWQQQPPSRVARPGACQSVVVMQIVKAGRAKHGSQQVEETSGSPQLTAFLARLQVPGTGPSRLGVASLRSGGANGWRRRDPGRPGAPSGSSARAAGWLACGRPKDRFPKIRETDSKGQRRFAFPSPGFGFSCCFSLQPHLHCTCVGTKTRRHLFFFWVSKRVCRQAATSPSILSRERESSEGSRVSFLLLPQTESPDMEPRSRSWALGLSFIGFFALLFSLGFVQQVRADDVSEYGTVIGIVSYSPALGDSAAAPGPRSRALTQAQ